MWDWLKSLFSKKETTAAKAAPQPRLYEVGRAHITITDNDGEVHHLEIDGTVLNVIDMKMVYPAHSRFKAWQEESGKTGMVSLDDGLFVPLNKIKNIQVTYSKLQIHSEDE